MEKKQGREERLFCPNFRRHKHTMRYTAQGRYGQPIELTDGNGTMLGSIKRTSWFSAKRATIITSAAVYELIPVGFFQTKVDVFFGGTLCFTLVFKPLGRVLITTERGATYTYKRTSILRGNYDLLSESEHPMVSIKPYLGFGYFGYKYDIETDDNYAMGRDPILLLLLVYAVNAMRRGAAAAM